MLAVMEAERALGNEPRDDSALKCGYDITSRQPVRPDDGLIEVKGRAKGATNITLTKNEIIAALNKPTHYWLAIVLVNEDDSAEGPHYLQGPVTQAPDWVEMSKNLELEEFLHRARFYSRPSTHPDGRGSRFRWEITQRSCNFVV